MLYKNADHTIWGVRAETHTQHGLHSGLADIDTNLQRGADAHARPFHCQTKLETSINAENYVTVMTASLIAAHYSFIDPEMMKG